MRNRRPTGWLLGFAGSAVAHVCALAALFAFGRVGFRPDDPAPGAQSEPIALVSVDAFFASPDPLATAIPVDVTPPARAWDAPEADRDSLVPVTAAPSDSDGRRRVAPAPDQGENGGHRPDHAYRRDDSTLRSRLTDGAAEVQTARTRTSGRPASPQAMRREPIVGIGDSVRTVTPHRAPEPSVTSMVALGGPTSGGPAGASAETAAASEAPLPVPSAELAARAVPARATGPLDAEQGARSFDDERFGKAAADDTVRASSNEAHPGRTDFNRSAAPAARPTSEGRGPGAHAGAVARPTSGTAASELGAPNRDALAADVAERARARRYAPYVLQIRNRVQDAVVFPRHLLIRLEQGVSVVSFVVGADGRVIDGPRLVKSSGFDDFDRAALQAVQRAAPFPPMPYVVPVSATINFENPVIR
jgi:TonB family protein